MRELVRQTKELPSRHHSSIWQRKSCTHLLVKKMRIIQIHVIFWGPHTAVLQLDDNNTCDIQGSSHCCPTVNKLLEKLIKMSKISHKKISGLPGEGGGKICWWFFLGGGGKGDRQMDRQMDGVSQYLPSRAFGVAGDKNVSNGFA